MSYLVQFQSNTRVTNVLYHDRKGVSMQTLFIFFSLMYFWTNALFANEIPKESIDTETLITEIKNAKPENRRVLMNQLKLELRAMNQENRAKTMMRLRKSFAKGSHQENGQKHQGGMMRQEKCNTPQHTPHRNIHKGMQKGQHKGQK